MSELICLAFVGLVAGFVDIGAKWLSHWRSGVCVQAFWLNREQCCWASSHVLYDDVHNEICDQVRLMERTNECRRSIFVRLVGELVRYSWFGVVVGLSVVHSLFHVCVLVGALCDIHRCSRGWLSSVREWLRYS